MGKVVTTGLQVGTSAQLLSPVQFFATPQTAVHQAPLSMGFSRQEYWSGLPFPTPRDLSDPGIEPVSPKSPSLQADYLLLCHLRSRESLNKFLKSIVRHALKSFSRREPLLSGKFSILYFFLASAPAKKASEAEIVLSLFFKHWSTLSKDKYRCTEI